jgi:DNA modification methylase
MSVDNLFEKSDLSKIASFEHSKNLPRHRWYYFKEGFSPLLVDFAIKKNDIKEKDLIIDVFSGSGTVPLVSSTANINSIGFEVNPFMTFVAKTKLSNTKESTFKFYLDKVINGIKKEEISNLEDYSTFCNNRKNDKWLFNKSVLRGFEGGWKTTKEIPCKVAKLYRLALVSAAMINSNAVKDGKCLRYKKSWKELSYSKKSLLDNFKENCDFIYEDLKDTQISKVATILEGDVREKLKTVKGKFKLCVTSPPYLNSFDYSDIYRPELFLCKYVSNNNNLGKLRLSTLRSHMQINWELPKKSKFGSIYQNCFNELLERKKLLWNNRIPIMIQAYFEDIEKLLIDLKKKAQKSAQLWIVVSTSAYAGIEIPVDLIIADISARNGWELEAINTIRYMRNSTQNAQKYLDGIGSVKRLRESIVILKNSN